jgi:hypothetical protein
MSIETEKTCPREIFRPGNSLSTEFGKAENRPEIIEDFERKRLKEVLRQIEEKSKEEDPEPEPNPEPVEPQPPRSSPISVNYTGTLSQKLVWDEAMIAQVAENADLRTRVLITSSSRQSEKNNTENLGEVLIYKKMVDLKDLFIRVRRKQEFEVTIDEKRARATVTIFDKCISERVRQSQQGRMDEAAFAEALNQSVNQALQSVISWEKMHQAKVSAGQRAIDLF